MSRLFPNPRGLIVKLALFYLLLSFPILLLVQGSVLLIEFRHLKREVNDGALTQALSHGAEEIRAGLSPRNFNEAPWIAWLEGWVIRMQLPGDSFTGEAAYILSELSREPLAAAFYSGDGELVAQAPPYRQQDGLWPTREQLLARSPDAGIQELPGNDGELFLRRVLSPVTDENELFVGWLYLELRVPHPWQKVIGDFSVEWPIALSFMVLFSIASSAFLTTYVTRRLNRVSAAAESWSRGDFSRRIGDFSPDELGYLSRSLDRMAEQLRELMHSRAQLATLQERQRLARDLHDTVKQKAFVLNLQLAAIGQKLKESPQHQALSEAQQLCHRIQQKLATLLDELRGDDHSFVQRFTRQVDDWKRYSNIEVRLHCDDFPALDAAIAEQLLRITDEALANVQRHSDATQVRINLHHDAGRLFLSISDNGNGQVPESAVGMGLKNIRERASQLPQSTCKVEGSTGHGTRIEVECELRINEP